MERMNENQYGAVVPTEYEAIKNLTAKPEVRVAHYDKPNLDEREKAANIFNESIAAGMSEAESLEMVKVSTGMDDKWLKCVPDWAQRLREAKEQDKSKHKIRYSADVKRKAVKAFLKYYENGSTFVLAVKQMNKELGTAISTFTVRTWVPSKKLRDGRKTRFGNSEETRKSAVERYLKCRETMDCKKSMETVRSEMGLTVSDATMFDWVRRYAPKTEEPKPETRHCSCGKEIPAEYAFCPYCGQRVETERERMMRYVGDVMTKCVDEETLARMTEVYSYLEKGA